MAKLKNGQALRKIQPEKTKVRVKSRPDWGAQSAAINFASDQSRRIEYRGDRGLGSNRVRLMPKGGFQIDDVTGREAVALFRRPAGTPTFADVFGVSKPDVRSLGENISIMRAYMHVKGFPPVPEKEPATTFATLFARFVLPRRQWPLFEDTKKGKADAHAFCQEWAAKVYAAVKSDEEPAAQPVFNRLMQPDCAAFYSPQYLGRGVSR